MQREGAETRAHGDALVSALLKATDDTKELLLERKRMVLWLKRLLFGSVVPIHTGRRKGHIDEDLKNKSVDELQAAW